MRDSPRSLTDRMGRTMGRAARSLIGIPRPGLETLQRPARYAIKTQPRRRPDNVKEARVQEAQSVLRSERYLPIGPLAAFTQSQICSQLSRLACKNPAPTK